MSKTVFVTVGTTKFEDLIRALDEPGFIAAVRDQGYTKISIQKGNGVYVPDLSTNPPPGLTVECFDYTPSLAAHLGSASLVISHAGSGSIFETLTIGKALIVVPNPQLMDNHQAELGSQLAAMKHLVCAEPKDLAAAVERISEVQLVPYEKGSAAGIAAAIDDFMGFGKAA